MANPNDSRVTTADRETSFVSEWFGFRVYPDVRISSLGLETQEAKRCPFLSNVTGEPRGCIKPAKSSGICTISSRSNGPRQDWLVCPFRAFSPVVLETAARALFPNRSLGADPGLTPAPALAREDVRHALTERLTTGKPVIVYLHNKLGGEISISRTDRSPELSFDVTMVELLLVSGAPSIGRFGILEVQTMDFHGSYAAVVRNLEDALRLHKADFHSVLKQNPGWLQQDIEGPNIANVFKRTFYQIMLKFQIGASDACNGCVLALPKSVWDSWQRHLGGPELQSVGDGLYKLTQKKNRLDAAKAKAWIIVFDIGPATTDAPSPVVLNSRIATTPKAVAQYALEVAPSAAVAEGGPISVIAQQIGIRLSRYWPDIAPGVVRPRRKRR
jgi:hypothetical protein